MNARQIEVFRAVMQEGTLTAAARRLHVSQPALSQLLLHAEDQLGFPLFSRVGGRLVPTAEAVRLFPEADRLHAGLEALRRLASDLRDGKTGTLRLATSAPPALSFVPRALAGFRAAYPGLRLVSHVVPASVVVAMLEGGKAELGVVLDDTAQPSLRIERIGQREVVCLLRSDHRLAALDAVSPEALAGEVLVGYRPDSLPGQLIGGAFAAAGLRYLPEIELDTSIGAPVFVQNGFGVALVDGVTPWAGFPGLVTRPFVPRAPLPVCLLSDHRRTPSKAEEQLREALCAAFVSETKELVSKAGASVPISQTYAGIR